MNKKTYGEDCEWTRLTNEDGRPVVYSHHRCAHPENKRQLCREHTCPIAIAEAQEEREFFVEVHKECPVCFLLTNCVDEDCPVCGGVGSWTEKHLIPEDTINGILEHYSEDKKS